MAGLEWLLEKKSRVPAKIHAKPNVTAPGRYADSGASLKHYCKCGVVSCLWQANHVLTEPLT